MRLAISIVCAVLCCAVFGGATTNDVLYVDQDGRLNAQGVASVEDVATNAAKVAVAEQKAEIAQNTAVAVSNSIQTVIQNLMENNEVIYRSGFSDSFAPLVVFTESDILAITDVRWVSRSSSQLVADIDYVCTVNMGTIKPTVMHRNVLSGGRSDFSELADANVSAPSYTAESTIPNPVSTTSYFIWIKADADAPSGSGATLDLANGVTGGITGEYTWGDRVLTFRGGVLMGVE